MSALLGWFRQQHPALLAVAFVIAGVAVTWAIEATVPDHKHPVKTVAVVVAAKDLPLGTPFTPDNIDELTAIVQVPRANLPNNYVKSKEELLDKRLFRAHRRGELLSSADVKTRAHVAFSGGREIATLFLADGLQNLHIDAGCRVDVVGVFEDGDRREVFTVLPDVAIFSVNAPDSVSIPVDEKQATLLSQCNRGHFNFELLLRAPDAPKRGFDYEKTLARVQGLRILAPMPHAVPIIAPAPRAKRMITLVVNLNHAAHAFIAPGSRVDVVTTITNGPKPQTLILLEDLLILAVSNEHDLPTNSVSTKTVMFQVSDQQARLLLLAEERGLERNLLLRNPSSPSRADDPAKVLALLQSLSKYQPNVAPPPRVKVEKP